MKNIMLCTADRAPGNYCLKKLKELQDNNLINVKAISAESAFKKKSIQMLDNNFVFIDCDKKCDENIYKTIINEKIDLLLSIQYKWIISKQVIEAVNCNAFNIHFGKLPDYRGHHTHVHPILNDEKNITTTLHWIQPEVDTGFIAFTDTCPILSDDTSISLMEKAVNSCITLLESFFNCVTTNSAIPKISIEGEGNFYGIKSIFELKQIKSVNDFEEVDRKSRAFYYPPHEPAYIILNNKKFFIIPKPQYNTP